MAEPEPPAAPGPTVDFTQLERVAGGDEELVLEVLGLFKGQAAIWKVQLDPASSAADFKGVAHSLKGSALAIGAGELARACETAETAAGQALPVREAAARQIRQSLETALEEIEAYLAARA